MNKRIIALTLIAALATPAIANAGLPGKSGKSNERRLVNRVKSESRNYPHIKDPLGGSTSATARVAQSKPGRRRANGGKKFIVDGIVRDIRGQIITLFVNAGTASVKDFRGRAVDIDAGSARIKKRGKAIALAQVKVGDRGHIAGSLAPAADNGLTLTAVRVNIKPERPEPARAALKKSSLKNETETGALNEGKKHRREAGKKTPRSGAASAILKWFRGLF